MKIFIMSKPVILTIILVSFMYSGFSQSKFEVNVGLGIPEAVSLKAKFGDIHKIGIYQGYEFGDIWMSGIEWYYYFSDKKKYNDTRTIYMMGGIASTLFAPGYERFEKIVPYYRIGKSFHLSPNIGINLDAGLSIIMADDIYGYTAVPFPTLSGHLFFRF